MAESVTHAFVSAKAQSPDTTLVSKNEWNDGHVFSGGINGQVLIYDSSQANNMKWVDGAKSYTGGNSTGAVASPLSTPTLVTITAGSNTIVQLNPDLACTTSGGASYTLDVKLNGATILTISGIASGAQFTYPYSFTVAAGTHTLSATLTASAGTFLSTAVNFRVFTAGTI